MKRKLTLPDSDDAKTAVLLGSFAFCTLIIGLAVLVDALFFAQGASLKREGGGLEAISAVLYVLGAGVFFTTVPRAFWVSLWQVPALLILFALRELDFDKAFTSSGVLSTALYRGESALGTKLIAGSVVLFVLVVVYRMLRMGLPAVIRALRARESWAFLVCAAAVTVVVSKSIDGLGRKLLALGIEISAGLDVAASTAEEIGEAFIPVFIILAILARWRGREA
jgi:hypothetical protein